MAVGRALALPTLCLLAAALALPPAGIARPAANELLITYVGSSSFRLAVNGSAVASGATVPAGSYNVLVDDPDYTTPRFVMTGPGVNISSDLNSTGMGIDRPATFGPFTLQPGSTYTARDTNSGASLTFSTGAAAGGTSGASSGGSSSSSGGASSGGSSSSSPSTKQAKTLGTLVASVSAAGKAALTLGGRPVKTLKAGVYAISVADHSAKAGLIVQKLGAHAIALSSAAGVGSHSSRLALSAGKWFFAPSGSGPKTYFSVSG
jgi:hypothetical protein